MASFQILLAGLLALALGGCVVAGPNTAEMIDDTLITGSITPTAPAPVSAADTADNSAIPDLERLSDRRTVRNAVSTADIEAAVKSYSWANPQTGTNGVISSLQEVRNGARICRIFQTSRQRFDGVALYNGEACTTGAGEWALVRFDENG